ncbi:hypothetical protein Msil_3901 [Methylocella silvestris BL2]|uniref:Uncharacterized protein n=1 Tax=Methylocella silvestris (strain DSM 15510 / CIP 108128 / LMG 27833 / NCIMB 13906 / BL2) TaxID=395965 RepID=B8EMV3_METSB|nr:hypothetical protein Msil_3901 [Methylocella silvestris BL2]
MLLVNWSADNVIVTPVAQLRRRPDEAGEIAGRARLAHDGRDWRRPHSQQIQDVRESAPWWISLAEAMSSITVQIAGALLEDFALYAVVMHPQSFCSLSRRSDDASPQESGAPDFDGPLSR